MIFRYPPGPPPELLLPPLIELPLLSGPLSPGIPLGWRFVVGPVGRAVSGFIGAPSFRSMANGGVLVEL